MGEAQLSTIVGVPGIRVADVRFHRQTAQKGRTTRKICEPYADETGPFGPRSQALSQASVLLEAEA